MWGVGVCLVTEIRKYYQPCSSKRNRKKRKKREKDFVPRFERFCRRCKRRRREGFRRCRWPGSKRGSILCRCGHREFGVVSARRLLRKAPWRVEWWVCDECVWKTKFLRFGGFGGKLFSGNLFFFVLFCLCAVPWWVVRTRTRTSWFGGGVWHARRRVGSLGLEERGVLVFIYVLSSFYWVGGGFLFAFLLIGPCSRKPLPPFFLLLLSFNFFFGKHKFSWAEN